jgi:hypothetical protein
MTRQDPADKQYECPCGNKEFHVWVTPMARAYLECTQCHVNTYGEEVDE